jgi:uncharacterized protein
VSRVVHFEIPAVNVEAAINFYTNVLGWKFQKWEGSEDYWLVTTGENGTPGIDGAIYRPEGPLQGTINSVYVENLDASLVRVRANGGDVVKPKMPVPGVGWLAYVKDPGGTIVGMMQKDPCAA